MDSSLYCSQHKDVDRSSMGTAMTDENGATVRRSTRESKQQVIWFGGVAGEIELRVVAHTDAYIDPMLSSLGPLN